MKFILIKDGVDTIAGRKHWHIRLDEECQKDCGWHLLSGWMRPKEAESLAKQLGAEICEPQKK